MTTPRTPRGRTAEDRATAYLQAHGHELIARNWRGGGGELDVVTRDGATLVFTEVKHRARTTHGTPLDAVTAAKLARVVRAAEAFMLRWYERTDLTCRVDVITIEGDALTGPLRHLQNVNG